MIPHYERDPITGEPLPRRKVPISWMVVLVVVLGVLFAVFMHHAITGRDERNQQRREFCIDRGGQAIENQYGRFIECRLPPGFGG